MGFNLSTELEVEEVTVNKQGDKIYISPEDAALFDNYMKCFDFVINQSRIRVAALEEIEKKYTGKEDAESLIQMAVEMSRVNVEFADESIREIDGIFGDGTVRKYFKDHYEKIPSFLPGIDCFMDFFNQMSPVMEEVFGKLIKGREEASKARMAKYQLQGHKKKGDR